MKRRTALLTVSLLFAVPFAQHGHSQSASLTADEANAIATDAYIYFIRW